MTEERNYCVVVGDRIFPIEPVVNEQMQSEIKTGNRMIAYAEYAGGRGRKDGV